MKPEARRSLIVFACVSTMAVFPVGAALSLGHQAENQAKETSSRAKKSKFNEVSDAIIAAIRENDSEKLLTLSADKILLNEKGAEGDEVHSTLVIGALLRHTRSINWKTVRLDARSGLIYFEDLVQTRGYDLQSYVIGLQRKDNEWKWRTLQVAKFDDPLWRTIQVKSWGHELSLEEQLRRVPRPSHVQLDGFPTRFPTKTKAVLGFGIEKQKSGQSRLHDGIDFEPSSKGSVIATGAGSISFIGMEKSIDRDGDQELVIRIDHPDRMQTVYRSAVRALVKKNDKVKRGQQIAIMGKEPLHYEVRIRGMAVDPMTFLLNPAGSAYKTSGRGQ